MITRPPVVPRYNPTQTEMARVNSLKEMMTESVISTLYDRVIDELGDQLTSITHDHIQVTNTQHLSFIFLGKYYNQVETAAPYPLPLHDSLHEKMREYLAEYHQVFNYEIPCIKGILKSMFIASDRISDYKQILPEQVHKAFDPFANTGNEVRYMQPAEITRLQKRIEPFITVMKGRMLQNFVQGQP